MPLTRDFKEVIQARVQRDPEFKKALFQNAMQQFVDGDMTTARLLLRDYVNATITFERLADLIDGKKAKSLMRMLSPKGNPTADNLSSIIRCLREETQVDLEVHAA